MCLERNNQEQSFRDAQQIVAATSSISLGSRQDAYDRQPRLPTANQRRAITPQYGSILSQRYRDRYVSHFENSDELGRCDASVCSC